MIPAREETIAAVRIQPTGVYCCGGKHNSRNHPGGVKFSVGGEIKPHPNKSVSDNNLPSLMTATKNIAHSVSSRRVSGASSYSSSLSSS